MLCALIRIASNRAILMSKLNIPLFIENRKDIPRLPHLPPDLSVMINSQWLELTMSRTFHGPKMIDPLRFDYISIL